MTFLKKHWRAFAIIGLLLSIYLLYALGQTLDCYLSLRYSPFLLGSDHGIIWTECVHRHLLFPFYLF